MNGIHGKPPLRGMSDGSSSGFNVQQARSIKLSPGMINASGGYRIDNNNF
jgi:hypothetical protein